MYRSEDAGETWAPANAGLTGLAQDVSAMVIDPETPARLLIGTRRAGVFITENRGESWSALNDGFSDTTLGTSIDALALDPSDPGKRYAGAGDGVHTFEVEAAQEPPPPPPPPAPSPAPSSGGGGGSMGLGLLGALIAASTIRLRRSRIGQLDEGASP